MRSETAMIKSFENKTTEYGLIFNLRLLFRLEMVYFEKEMVICLLIFKIFIMGMVISIVQFAKSKLETIPTILFFGGLRRGHGDFKIHLSQISFNLAKALGI